VSRQAVYWVSDAMRSEGSIGASDYATSVATCDDIPQILDLQKANLITNGGKLSIEFSLAWFENSIKEMPIIVARRGDQLVGYLVSSYKSATEHLPLSQPSSAPTKRPPMHTIGVHFASLNPNADAGFPECCLARYVANCQAVRLWPLLV